MTTDHLDLMTAQEVAQLFRLSERHIVRLATRRELPGVKLGQAWRFNRADMLAWFQSKANQEVSHGRL